MARRAIDWSEVEVLAGQGLSALEVSVLTGINVKTLYKICKRRGIVLGSGHARRQREYAVAREERRAREAKEVRVKEYAFSASPRAIERALAAL